jgi:pimeloyl-ACP methyl ester carboxylesterase
VPNPPTTSAAEDLVTSDGVALACRRWIAADPVGVGIVLVHGFTATKDEPAVVHAAETLAGAGFDVLSYDARGHGDSGGECTLGYHEHLDVAAAFEALRPEHDQVVLVGASMGSIAMLRFAAEADGYAGVVSVSGPAKWRIPRTGRSILAALVTQTKWGRKVASSRMNVRLAERWTRMPEPADMVHRITAPLVIVHGLGDKFLRPEEAIDLYDAANDPRRLMLVEGMGHAFDRPAADAIVDAVQWVLRANAA